MSSHVPAVDKGASQNGGVEDLGINNTWVRRMLTRLALKTTAHFYRSQGGSCVSISRNLIVKIGPRVHLTEAATMKFVAAKTSLPVPRVHCAFVRRGMTYIVMERMKGDVIAESIKFLPEEALGKLLGQLRTLLDEMRSLEPPPPGTAVESCVGGSLRDSRIPRSNPRFGPFETIQDFHLWLRDGTKLEDLEDREQTDGVRDVRRMITLQDLPRANTRFTHGDLNSCNILVREGKIVGIIDWEFAGWYPDYWEYTSAWCGNIIRPNWQELIPQFLDTFPEELEMEITRGKAWGDLF
uniref:Aminoglycoside phosphotransferase domain-containing protein n=1 Tax=Bionectria ochroleuca TaxID=29856 RepID=A0A8H7K9W5_BIOOC